VFGSKRRGGEVQTLTPGAKFKTNKNGHLGGGGLPHADNVFDLVVREVPQTHIVTMLTGHAICRGHRETIAFLLCTLRWKVKLIKQHTLQPRLVTFLLLFPRISSQSLPLKNHRFVNLGVTWARPYGVRT